MPAAYWSHTADSIASSQVAGKVVGIVGAGSSAFDAAGFALENGATEVHMFNRRPNVAYQGPARPGVAPAPAGPPPDRGHPNVLALSFELPDIVRWRNFVARDRAVSSVPTDSIARATGHDNFMLHLNSSLEDVTVDNNQIRARANAETWRFDHIISGTGYRIDLAAQSELDGIADAVELWGNRYEPEAGDESDAAAIHPYLGPAFEFLPRNGANAEHLRNIHCFNLAAALSFGKPVGDVPSAADHPRLVNAIARDLYIDSVDTEAHREFINRPATAQDPAPYEGSVYGRTRSAG